MKVRTNNTPRDVIDGSQLTPAERAKFDYLDWPAIEAGTDSALFFRYRGTVHDMSEFMRTTGELADAGWQGYSSDSYSSATVIRITDDGEGVVVGYATT